VAGLILATLAASNRAFKPGEFRAVRVRNRQLDDVIPAASSDADAQGAGGLVLGYRNRAGKCSGLCVLLAWGEVLGAGTQSRAAMSSRHRFATAGGRYAVKPVCVRGLGTRPQVMRPQLIALTKDVGQSLSLCSREQRKMPQDA